MNKQDLVSIIIPTYNRAHLLSRAIESCLKQSYQNIEVIIVDDCSSDNTYEIVNNYLNKIRDKRIIYIKNNKNEGAAYTRNIGIGHSGGNFLMFLDSDCEYLPEKVDEEITLMHSLDFACSIIYSNLWRERKDAETILSLKIKSKLLIPEDIFSCKYYFLDPTTWFCRSDTIKKLNGFDRDCYSYDDIDLLIRAILNGEGIYFYNKPLSIKHKTEGISDVSFKSVLAKEIFLNKHFLRIKKYKKYLSKLYSHIGKDLFKLGDFKKAKDYFWQAFLSEPFKIEYFFKSLSLNFKSQKLKKKGSST
jgi:glycosyltransferase involved in cell wall biosynthesis